VEQEGRIQLAIQALKSVKFQAFVEQLQFLMYLNQHSGDASRDPLFKQNFATTTTGLLRFKKKP
jgi:hypothetical protein